MSMIFDVFDFSLQQVDLKKLLYLNNFLKILSMENYLFSIVGFYDFEIYTNL